MADRPQNKALAGGLDDAFVANLLGLVDETVDAPARRQQDTERRKKLRAQAEEDARFYGQVDRGLGRIETATQGAGAGAMLGAGGGPAGALAGGALGFAGGLATGLTEDIGQDIGYASAAGLPEDQRVARANAAGGAASAALILLTLASNWKQLPTLFQRLRAMSPAAAAEVAQAAGAKNVDDFLAAAVQTSKKSAQTVANQVKTAAGSGALANLSDDTVAALTKASEGLVETGKDAANVVKKGSKLWGAAKTAGGIALGSAPFIAYDALTKEKPKEATAPQGPYVPSFMEEQARKTENLYRAAEARQTPEDAKARYATLAALAAGPGEEMKREAANWLAANFVETMTHNQNVELMQQQYGFGNDYMDRVLGASQEIGMDRPRLILPPGSYWPDGDQVTSAAAELGGAFWEPTPFEVE